MAIFKNLKTSFKDVFGGALKQAEEEFKVAAQNTPTRSFGAEAPTSIGPKVPTDQRFQTSLSAPTKDVPTGRVEQRELATGAIDRSFAEKTFSELIRKQFAELDAAKAPGENAKEVFQTATAPFGALFGGIGNVLVPSSPNSGGVFERFKAGAKGQLAENFGFTEGLPARQQLGGRIVRSAIDPIQKPDYSGGTGRDIAQTAKFALEIPKEVFAQSVIFGINLLADPETYVGFKGAKKADEVVQFAPKIKAAFKKAGLMDEVAVAFTAAKKKAKVLAGEDPLEVFTDNFLNEIDKSPNKQRILQVLGEQSGEAKAIVPNPNVQAFKEGIGLEVPSKNLGGLVSPSSVKDKAIRKQVAKSAVYMAEGKLPPKKITMTERALLAKKYKEQAVGARAGAKFTKEALQLQKKKLATFIQEVIPDTNITNAEAKRLIGSVASAATEGEFRRVRSQALDLASRAFQKETIRSITEKVTEALSTKNRFTPAQLRNAQFLKGKRAFSVADQEQKLIASILDFVSLDPNSPRKVRQYRSAEAFLKQNPDFKDMPRSVIEGISNLNKTPLSQMSFEDLTALEQKIDEIVYRGKVRSSLLAMNRGRVIEQQIDALADGSVNVGEWTKDSVKAIFNEVDDQFMTTMDLADLIDGGPGRKSAYKTVGENYRFFVQNAREVNNKAALEAGAFKDEVAQFFDELNLTDEEKLRIGYHAYSKQPGVRKAILSNLKKRGVSLSEVGAELTEREQAAYDYMRAKLDSIKPEIDAVSMETRGSSIGFIKDYFPISKKADEFLDIVDVMEGSVRKSDGAQFKKSAEFKNLRERSVVTPEDLELDIDPVSTFLRYMDAAIYYKNWEPFLSTARAVVGSERYGSAAGRRGQTMMGHWIARMSRRGAKEAPFKDATFKILDNGSAWVKRNLAVAYMAQVATTLKQFTGGLVAGGYIGPRRVLEGFALLADPKMRRFAFENSMELRHRSGGDLTLFELEKQFKGGAKKTPFDQIRKVSATLLRETVERSDALTATGVWLGAYRHAIGIFDGDEAKAFQYADDIVNRTQASGHFKDISRAQNYNELLNSIAFPFSTFSINQYNVIRNSLKTIGLDGSIYEKATSAGVLLAVAMSIMAEQSVEYMFADEKYKGDGLVDYWAKNLPVAAFSGFPIVGQILNSAAMSFGGGSFQPLVAREVDRGAKGMMSIVRSGFTDFSGVLDLVRSGSAIGGLPVNAARDLHRFSKILGIDPSILSGARDQLPVPQLGQPNLGQPQGGYMDQLKF